MTIAIIGIIASVAVPSSETTRHQEILLAASVTADALRFAREQARLTGNHHGVDLDIGQQQLSVYRLDRSVSPPGKVFDVMHPLARQPYVIDFSRAPYKMTTLATHSGQPSGSCSDSSGFVFDSSGVVRCTNPLATRFSSPFIEFKSDGLTQSVAIDGYSGRVTIP